MRRRFVTVTQHTHARLKQEAAQKGRPLTELADLLLNRALDDYELVNEIPQDRSTVLE